MSMRLVLAGSAAIVAAIAVGVAGLTGVERNLVDWSFACTVSAEPPCGPGAEVGKEYYYALWTHCGPGAAVFDGRLWMARPGDRHSLHANVTEGTMRLLADDVAEFRTGRFVGRFEVTTLDAIPPCY
jgi:hypothetical protein